MTKTTSTSSHHPYACTVPSSPPLFSFFIRTYTSTSSLYPIPSRLSFFLMIRRPPRSTLFPSATLFFFNDTATTEIYTLSLHDALPISPESDDRRSTGPRHRRARSALVGAPAAGAAVRDRAGPRRGTARNRNPGGEDEIGRAHV